MSTGGGVRARPRGPAIAAPIAVWVLGVIGPTQRLFLLGHNGHVAGPRVAALGLLLAMSLAVADDAWGRRPSSAAPRLVAGGLAVAVGAVVAGEVWTQPLVGRAPWPVTVALLVAAHVATRPTRRTNAHRDALSAVPFLVVAGWVWYLRASPAITGAFLGLGLLVVAVARWWPTILAPVDGACRRVAAAAAVAVGRGARSAVLAVAGTAVRLAPAARSAALTGLRAVVSIARWVPRTTTRVARTLAQALASATGATARRLGRVLAFPATAPLVAAVAGAPIFWRFVVDPSARLYGFNDYQSHLEGMRAWSWTPLVASSPHFAFEATASAVSQVIGDRLGPALVLGVGAGAYVAVVAWFARRTIDGNAMSPTAAALVGLMVFAVESPIAAVDSLRIHHVNLPYAQIHVWGNPTDVLAVPAAFLLLAVLLVPLDAEAGRWWRPTRLHLLLALVTVAATVAKPTTVMTVLPALAVYLVVSRRMRTGLAAELALWSALPGAAVFLWQNWFIHHSAQAGRLGFTHYGVHLDPGFSYPVLGGGPGGPVLFWSAALWPLLATALAGRRFWRDPAVAISASSFLITLPMALLVREDPPFQNDGDFIKPLQYSWILLVVLSIVVVMRELVASSRARRTGGARRRWLVPFAVVMTVSWLAGGLALYLDAAGIAGVGRSYPVVCKACR
jgi:hypothetical protein